MQKASQVKYFNLNSQINYNILSCGNVVFNCSFLLKIQNLIWDKEKRGPSKKKLMKN